MSFATLQFTPWRKFRPELNEAGIHQYLHALAKNTHRAFQAGMSASSVPSSPGAYPGVRTGRLRGSIRTEVKAREMTVGTSMHYSIYLRMGTRKMAARKMSPGALAEGRAATPMSAFQFARWRLG